MIPPRKIKLPIPPRRVILPQARHVKVMRNVEGYYIATSFLGAIVGSRLDRGRGEPPMCAAQGIKTLDEAIKAMKLWDTFVHANII